MSKGQVAAVAAREEFQSSHIPMSGGVSPSVVSTQNGDYLSTWFVKGLSFEGLTDDEVYARMNAINLLIRGLSNGKYAFWIHRLRRQIADELTAPPEDTFAGYLAKKYYASLSNGGLMATEIYVTVLYRPFPQRSTRLLGKVGRSMEDIAIERKNACDVLETIHQQILSSLSEYGVRRLEEYEHNGKKYSHQREFYSYLINGHWWRVPVKDVPLHKYLPVARPKFGNELVEMVDSYGSTFSAFVDLKDYTDYSEPGVLNTLISLPFEYVETHSFAPMTLLDGRKSLKLQRNRLASSEDSSERQIAEMNVAIDELSGGTFSVGEYHYSLQVKGATPEFVRGARSVAIEALGNAGFLGVPLDLVTQDAFDAQLPGNFRHRPRVAQITSRNFTGLCSMHNFTMGKREGNPWGEAVTILRSPASQPVYFNFHASPLGEDSFGQPLLGNTQIVGKSRGGKTVLALFLASALEKYGTQWVYFDKDRGAEIAIRAGGGRYLALARGVPTGFAPFKLDPTDENILLWEDIIKFCARVDENNAKEEAEVAHAVRAVAQLSQADRSFGTVMQNLVSVGENTVMDRLKKWCKGGPLGWCLDNDEDLLVFEDGRNYGFDYTEFLDDKVTCPAIMMYLLARVERLIDGRRFAFFMDEYWKALEVKYFEDFAKNKQKTIGKQNGFGVFITQSPSDTVKNPIAKTLIEQTATFIFLPNPSADYDDYVNGFKVSEAVFKLIQSLQENSRMFVIKQGESVHVATLDLKGFDQELMLLSGTTKNVERLDKLRARLGDEPSDWVEPFLMGES